MKLSVSLSKKELGFGAVLLALELLALPHILRAVDALTGGVMPAIILNLIMFVTNLTLTLVIFHRFLWQNLTIALHNPKKTIGTALLGLLLYYGGAFLMAMLIVTIKPDFANINDATIAIMSEGWYPLMLVCTTILVPTAEETMYRGLLFCGSGQKLGRIAGYAISACVFSLIHVVNYIGQTDVLTLLLCFLQYLPGGIALAWAYEEADTIVAPILMHTLINLVSMLALR